MLLRIAESFGEFALRFDDNDAIIALVLIHTGRPAPPVVRHG